MQKKKMKFTIKISPRKEDASEEAQNCGSLACSLPPEIWGWLHPNLMSLKPRIDNSTHKNDAKTLRRKEHKLRNPVV